VKQGLAAWLVSQQQGSSPAEEELAHALAEACALFAAAKKHHDSSMFPEGEQQVRRAVELRTRVLGAENSETLAANLLLASLLKKQKKMDEAKIVYEEALAAARRVLGDDSEDTLACMNNLAVLLKQQGKLDDAKKAMQKLQKDLGSKALIDQRQNQTVADKQAEAMAKMGEAMDKLNIILKPIAKAFEFIGKADSSCSFVQWR
jgi:tetratricopeptide (TPR) repeat protein